MVGGAGGHHQARALKLIGDDVNVRRPPNEGVERSILNEDLGGRRRIRSPLEVHVAWVNPSVNEQRHDEVMAGGVLGQNYLFALAIFDAEVVDAANFAAR